jgi:CheY-like chemotaxis protein
MIKKKVYTNLFAIYSWVNCMDYSDAGLVISKSGKQEVRVIESQVACDGVKLLIKAGDAHFGIPCQKFEYSTVDNVPVSLDYAEYGAAFQWSSYEQEYRMVIETDSTPLRQLLRSVCAANLNGRELRIKQRVSPSAVDAEIAAKITSTTTSVTVDADTGIIALDDSDFSNIMPEAATTVLIGSVADGDNKTGVQVEMLTPDQTVTTRMIFDSPRVSQLARDYIVAEYTVSGTGGPISVLLIDDEPPLTDLAKAKIEEHHANMSIVTATSVEAANKILNTQSVDCVVSDYSMPGEDIGSLTAMMKHTDNALPFVIFSRMAEGDVAPEDRPDNVDEWIQKDVGAEQYRTLGAVIKRLIAKKRYPNQSGVKAHPDPTALNDSTRTV